MYFDNSKMEIGKFIYDFERAVLKGNKDEIDCLFQKNSWNMENEGRFCYGLFFVLVIVMVETVP